ncbi:MAG: pseudouridine synthase [Alphaproteobacteria bacterium]|nr:pseudouridine synthase [Alphaproteobacteria bacterium]
MQSNIKTPINITERLAKWIAHAGYCSRRHAERLIQDGLVSVDGEIVLIPQTPVSDDNVIIVEGNVLRKNKVQLWLYHKPSGLVTTHADPEGRPTVFESLPAHLPHVISVGRLDLHTEGLLLLTNFGPLARKFEHPSSNLTRTYHVRVYGALTDIMCDMLAKGLEVDGVSYAPIEVTQVKGEGSNQWIEMILTEGKNREIRNVLGYFHLRINKLIRTAYGPFELDDLKPGEVKEVNPKTVADLMKHFGL